MLGDGGVPGEGADGLGCVAHNIGLQQGLVFRDEAYSLEVVSLVLLCFCLRRGIHLMGCGGNPVPHVQVWMFAPQSWGCGRQVSPVRPNL